LNNHFSTFLDQKIKISFYFISFLLGQNETEDVLKLLNSNVESPYLIWDNGTRAELTDFLENERTSTVRRGTCDPSFGSEFKFTAHKDEIVVGNIFIRIYNQQPMFQLEVFKLFILHLQVFSGGLKIRLHLSFRFDA
jgi:DnaJ family protein C protein 13